MQIQEVTSIESKSNICNAVLRSLPEWFGIEESIVEYVDKVKQMPFYAAYHEGTPVGFVAIKIHNAYTAEVYVMGVMGEYHKIGIGSRLISRVEEYCHENHIQCLTVKTLADTVEYEPYARTRRFYSKMGFIPLEVFPLLWDVSNPCLFLAKKL